MGFVNTRSGAVVRKIADFGEFKRNHFNMKFYRDLCRAQARRRNTVIFKLPICLYLICKHQAETGFSNGSIFLKKKILTVNGETLRLCVRKILRRRK